ncbi:MAG: hypothetical protein ACE14S_03945 [Candidatus Bathyarchaeia archaeon]
MPRIDRLDEVVINAPPMVVYKAVLNEYAGVTHWWMPYLEFKLRGDLPIDREGAIGDMIFHFSKRASSKSSFKVAKIVEAKSLEIEYAGDIVGTGTWTFEPTDGKTKVQYRANSRTNSLLAALVSPFVDFGKGHSDVTQKGFKALSSYLSEK